MASVLQFDSSVSDYRRVLEEHGISEADENRMGLQLIPPAVIKTLLGFDHEPRWHGMLIPYPGGGGEDYIRVRRLGKVGVGESRYFSPKGSGHGPVYTPAWSGVDWEDIKVNPEEPLVITEGELKADCCFRVGGVTAVGIGGVTMIRALFDGGWAWKGRSVLICFDHDPCLRDGTPIIPGEYKPEVRKALGKLASTLVARGASVQILSVGMAALPLNESGRKWGIDDYLLAVGAEGWRALLGTARAPEPWVVELGEMLENCVLVRGTNQTHAYDLRFGSRKGLRDFHEAWGEQMMEGHNGKPKPISHEWYKHHQRLTVSNYCLDPGQPYGPTPGKPSQLNLWKPYPSWDSIGTDSLVFTKWGSFVKGLFGEDVLPGTGLACWQWVCLWVAHMLERPQEPTSQAVLVHTSVVGIGKSLFAEIVGRLVGRDHYCEVPNSRLDARFNAQLEGVVWAVTNELDILYTSREGMLGDLITAEDIDIECKGKDVITLPNLLRRYMTSNSSAPCRLGKGQRRILVVYPPRVSADTRGEWGTWVGSEVAGWKGSSVALASIREWFGELWGEHCSTWNPTAPVPLTEASNDLTEASLTTTQRLVEDLIGLAEENGGVLAIDPISKRARSKVWAEFSNSIRARGGQVGRKTIRLSNKLDGTNKLIEFSVYDLHRTLETKAKITAGGVIHTPWIEIESDRARMLALSASRLIAAQESEYGIRRD